MPIRQETNFFTRSQLILWQRTRQRLVTHCFQDLDQAVAPDDLALSAGQEPAALRLSILDDPDLSLGPDLVGFPVVGRL